MKHVKTIVVALALAVSGALSGGALAHSGLKKVNAWNFKPTNDTMEAEHEHYHEEWKCYYDDVADLMVYHYHYIFGSGYDRMSEKGLIGVYISSSNDRDIPNKVTYFFDPKKGNCGDR